MRFETKFHCDNAAFDDYNLNAETASVLRQLADRVERGDIDNLIGRTQHHDIRDCNGNTIGTATFIRESGE